MRGGFDLERFLAAQNDPDDGFETALREVSAGRKVRHWIWYVLPQLEGLGQSSMARRFGLAGIDEAFAYLEHPVLRDRLLAVVKAIVGQLRRTPPPRLDVLMGSAVDARKLVSSMTLFGAVARRLATSHPDVQAFGALASAATTLLNEARRQGLPPCAFTNELLSR
jgi:uncharacterized protein (DUF1810 family)